MSRLRTQGITKQINHHWICFTTSTTIWHDWHLLRSRTVEKPLTNNVNHTCTRSVSEGGVWDRSLDGGNLVVRCPSYRRESIATMRNIYSWKIIFLGTVDCRAPKSDVCAKKLAVMGGSGGVIHSLIPPPTHVHVWCEWHEDKAFD